MTTSTFPTRIVQIDYRPVQMLPVAEARDWVTGNFVDAGEGWVGIQDGRAYITDGHRPVRLGPHFPGQAVTPLPEALAAKAERFLIAGVDLDGDHFALSARVPAEDVDGSESRTRLGFRIMASVEKKLAVPCSSCDERNAFSSGTVEGQPVQLCRTCMGERRERGVDLGGLMPLLAFTEYDA